MEEIVKTHTLELQRAILQSEVYQNYKKQKDKVDGMPELKEQINRYRQERYDLQNIQDEGLLFDKMEEFDRKYEAFESDPIVDAYLSAELDFCRAMQEMYLMLADGLEFE